jgi:osmotically-inducible protein OsmY
MFRRFLAAFAALSFLWAGQRASGQGFNTSSAFRGSSMGNSFGSSQFGSGFGSSSFGSGFGSNGFGSSGFGRSGFGSSGFGSNGFGNSGFGNSGFGNNTNVFMNSGFGNGYGGGQNFVGRDSADMSSTFGQMSRAGTQFFNSMNRNMSRQNAQNKQSAKATQNPAQPTRVAVHVAFDVPKQAPNQLADTIRTRLAKILAEHRMAQPTIAMDGDTVVLTGTASSESERDVISRLIAIEPGVRDVRNNMTVGQPATAPVAPAPGS